MSWCHAADGANNVGVLKSDRLKTFFIKVRLCDPHLKFICYEFQSYPSFIHPSVLGFGSHCDGFEICCIPKMWCPAFWSRLSDISEKCGSYIFRIEEPALFSNTSVSFYQTMWQNILEYSSIPTYQIYPVLWQLDFSKFS
jgi:hypothetical protein